MRGLILYLVFSITILSLANLASCRRKRTTTTSSQLYESSFNENTQAPWFNQVYQNQIVATQPPWSKDAFDQLKIQPQNQIYQNNNQNNLNPVTRSPWSKDTFEQSKNHQPEYKPISQSNNFGWREIEPLPAFENNKENLPTNNNNLPSNEINNNWQNNLVPQTVAPYVPPAPIITQPPPPPPPQPTPAPMPQPPSNPHSVDVDSIIDANCLKCLCFIESWCSDVGCVMDEGSMSCGWYQLKREYWIDCGQPGGSWETCANSKSCAEGCVKKYLKRYSSQCYADGGLARCQDLARLHNGGPYGCKAKNTEYYGWLISRCLRRESPYENIDTYPVPHK